MQSIFDVIPCEKLALKPAEAAKLMNVSLPTVYALIKSETAHFPSIRVGNTGRGIIVPTIPLMKWLDIQAGGNGDLSFLPSEYRLVHHDTDIGNRGAVRNE